MNILARSENLIIQYEFEVVELEFLKGNKFGRNQSVIIGDFYGDPKCAFISYNEKFCVIGGCGIIIYWIKKPFESFAYGKKTQQYKELYRDSEDIWWIDTIYEGNSDDMIRFVVDPADELRKGVYEMNVRTLETVKLI